MVQTVIARKAARDRKLSTEAEDLLLELKSCIGAEHEKIVMMVVLQILKSRIGSEWITIKRTFLAFI
ncbi:hypothetical protein GOP47_0019608 [Adiantum capillus-veneris]|uniref:Uncharacterized protein n=1 Tax=Adiantum capillus-veneris TaxID=13818 RepID=A0A9D4Z780_ADICA|nr:hypothetical protein GOP47_0019608 [Adiantum capillus-veneris]